jgi:putative transposase
MPRKKRLCIPGAIHHVMSRGIEGRTIFADAEDRSVFMGIFATQIAKIGFKCYAWVLMDNHYHFVLRTNEKPLSSLFKPLNATYARYFGKRYGRRGYLFQERFKSIATQDQGYLEQLIRYVHLNPLRAGICKTMENLDRYRWCGHSAIVGKESVPFQDVGSVRRRFGKTMRDAIRNYRAFLGEGIQNAGEDDFIEKLRLNNENKENIHDPGCWVIGDSEFVKSALHHDEQNRLRLARYRKDGWDLEQLCGAVGKALGIAGEEIRKRGRLNARSTARKVFAAIAHRKLGIPVSEIAHYLGTSGSAVSCALDKGDQIVAEKKLEIII